MMDNNLEVIGDISYNGQRVIVTRDVHGKFYIKVDTVMTQKRLTASEIVRWCLNLINDNSLPT